MLSIEVVQQGLKSSMRPLKKRRKVIKTSTVWYHEITVRLARVAHC